MDGKPAHEGGVIVRMTAYFATDDILSRYVGDLDKLERNLLDALTDAKVYGDDRQVVMNVTNKVIGPHGVQGLQVEVIGLPQAPGELDQVTSRIAADLADRLHKWVIFDG